MQNRFQFISDFVTKTNRYDDYFLEKAISWLLFIPSLFTFGTILKIIFAGKNVEIKRRTTNIYVLTKTLFSFLVLRLDWFQSAHGSRNWIFGIIIWFTLETVNYNLLQILCSNLFNQIGSFKRNLFLGFLNYLEIIFNFSIFYSALHLLRSSTNMTVTASYNFIDYIYFSIGSGGIIGYGDYRVYTNTGKILVITQGILLLMFFSLFVSYNINMMSGKKSRGVTPTGNNEVINE